MIRPALLRGLRAVTCTYSVTALFWKDFGLSPVLNLLHDDPESP